MICAMAITIPEHPVSNRAHDGGQPRASRDVWRNTQQRCPDVCLISRCVLPSRCMHIHELMRCCTSFDDRHVLTCGTMQVIFKGATTRCLPPLMRRSGKKFKGWLWGFTDNHWSNLEEQQKLVRLVIAPYCKQKIEELNLPPSQRVAYLLDCWPVHISTAFRQWMKEQYPWILLLFVPPNCTAKLQPQDKFYQKPFKLGTKTAFCNHQVQLFQRAKATGVWTSVNTQLVPIAL